MVQRAEEVGGMELAKLIRSMSPILDPRTFVFATLNPSDSRHSLVVEQATSRADMLFWENEGVTVIITEKVAEELGIDFIFPCRKVTLSVHSSLEAVGFLAAVTSRLANKLSIGVNPVSGYFHDHLFVPLGKEELVMEELKAMAAE